MKRHTLAVSNPIHEVPEELQMKLQPIRTSRRPSDRSERGGSRDSYKDVSSLHLPNERFSPTRRASDSLASSGLHKYQLSNLEKIYNQTVTSSQQSGSRQSSPNSLKQLQQECHELQVGTRNLF